MVRSWRPLRMCLPSRTNGFEVLRSCRGQTFQYHTVVHGSKETYGDLQRIDLIQYILRQLVPEVKRDVGRLIMSHTEQLRTVREERCHVYRWELPLLRSRTRNHHLPAARLRASRMGRVLAGMASLDLDRHTEKWTLQVVSS